MSRVIRANELEMLKMWVDASYTIYKDMWVYTGGVISIGHGIIHGKCARHKLNTRNSTETEVVGTRDYILWTIWAKRSLQQ